MQRFDCLKADCPLFGPHLLEASAGTGKTFAIEHIFVRLVLEGMDLERILVVTFTRAATRELKTRIRSNLEKALASLEEQRAEWDYLNQYIGSEEAKRLLRDALGLFDRSQIFTIHGFCFRMLQEFAFEAKVGFGVPHPDLGKKIPDGLRLAALDFLESGIDEKWLCPEQMSTILRKNPSLQQLSKRLFYSKGGKGSSFAELTEQCKAALHCWNIEEGRLLEDFYAIKEGFKKKAGDHEAQVRALANCDLRILLKEKGSLFKFVSAGNRKVKMPPHAPLHYPGFFDWAAAHIAPLVEEGNKKGLRLLQMAWQPIEQKILTGEEHLGPDEILNKMKESIQREEFAARIRNQYEGVIIDEFQDTDATQWEIFEKLFLNAKALYLVGDPKQSIYRFRKADVYTYLHARDLLGENHLYHLDTNFRSSKQLIGALNALFSREWLHLPQANRALPYIPVQAGKGESGSFTDGKGSVHFMVGEGDPDDLFNTTFLPYAVNEIEKLQGESVAILVKDRYQAQMTLDLLRERGIAAVAKSHIAIGETVAFQAIRELFEAILRSRSQSCIKVVELGPFGGDLPFDDYKLLLVEKGLVPFARAFLTQGMQERLKKGGFYADVMQIFEFLFAWEKEESFTFEGLARFLDELEALEADEGGRRLMEVDENAVQVMTIHTSKGLEFDTVFALGLISPTPEPEEEANELDAEKLRLLYVCMTRAKTRLYVPMVRGVAEAEGTQSAMELFLKYFELDELKKLTQSESISIETLQAPFVLPEKAVFRTAPPPAISYAAPLFEPSYLSSFTSLARPKEIKIEEPLASDPLTLHTMPRGAETGIVIHGIFEELFSAKNPIWQEPDAIDKLVEEALRFSPLFPWKIPIQEMVREIVAMPLGPLSLSELQPSQVQVEMEFVFSKAPDLIKGFIDLVFFHEGKYYFLDWKTNWLGHTDADYAAMNLQKSMEDHDYGLQAALYGEALRRYIKEGFGGAFYVYVRGKSFLHFNPAPIC